jgi:hypothetical protein
MAVGLLSVMLAGRLWSMRGRAVVPMVFGELGDTSALGASALESLGYQLDPVSNRLKPVELLMI